MPDDNSNPRFLTMDAVAALPDRTRVVIDWGTSALPAPYVAQQTAAYVMGLDLAAPEQLNPEQVMEQAKTDPTRTFGLMWSDSILVSAIAYLQTGEMISGDFSTKKFFGIESLDPLEILRKAFRDAAEGFGEDIALNSLNYLNGQTEREPLTTEKFFAQPDSLVIQIGMLGRTDAPLTPAESRLETDEVAEPVMLKCCTEEHEYEEGTDPDCDCTNAECGCSYNPNDTSTCDRCSQCEDCCNNNGECFTCGGCDRRRDSGGKCENCDECARCCNNNGECPYCESCEHKVSSDDFCGNCDRCTANDCCSCWSCGGCGESYRSDGEESSCGECSRCSSCCSCTRCGYCTDLCAIYCQECERCNDCCRGNEDCDPQPVNARGRASSTPATGGQPIKFERRDLQFHDSGRLQFKTNPLRRHISVEMEVDNFSGNYPRNAAPKLKAAVEKWGDSVVEDGSLHAKGAHEVNTQPTNGDRFLEHIKDLTDGYAEIGGSCSGDCGMHVHVNAKDLSFYDMRKVLAVYARTERALFELCGLNRLNGTYSQICGFNYLNMSAEPRMFKRQMFGTLYAPKGQLLPAKPKAETKEWVVEGRGDKDGIREHSIRYRALNIHSYFHRGSIEFRHHEGSVDYTEATNWALICGYVVDAAAKMSEAQIIAMPEETHEALLAILPDRFHGFCNTKWEAKPVPATIFRGAYTEYARRDSVWATIRSKGTLPPTDGTAPAGPVRCGYCEYNGSPSVSNTCRNCGRIL